MFHVQQGGGAYSIVQTNDLGRKTVSFGGLFLKPEGTMPAKPDKRPAFRPNVPCEAQQVPDLNAPTGPAEQLANPKPVASAANTQREAAAQADLKTFFDRIFSAAKGTSSADPLQKYNSQLGKLAIAEANKLLQVPMQKLARRPDNPARSLFMKVKATDVKKAAKK
jgi:hypothetical protein